MKLIRIDFVRKKVYTVLKDAVVSFEHGAPEHGIKPNEEFIADVWLDGNDVVFVEKDGIVLLDERGDAA